MLTSSEIADARKYSKLPSYTPEGIAKVIAPRHPHKHASIVGYVLEARAGP